MNATRALGVAGCAWGAALMTRPRAVAETVAAGRAVPAPWIVRLLGARQFGQGATLLWRPDRRRLLTGAGIDTVHAISMLGLAAANPRYRRAALLSAAVAGTSAALAAEIGSRG